MMRGGDDEETAGGTGRRRVDGEEDVREANSKAGWFLAMLLLASVLSVGSVLRSVFMRVCVVFVGVEMSMVWRNTSLSLELVRVRKIAERALLLAPKLPVKTSTASDCGP